MLPRNDGLKVGDKVRVKERPDGFIPPRIGFSGEIINIIEGNDFPFYVQIEPRLRSLYREDELELIQ